MEIKKQRPGGNPGDLGPAVDLFLTDSLYSTKKVTKRKRILAWLIVASRRGHRVTRFDAEPIGDHCLNTTVSEIGHLDGIEICRASTKRPTRFGVEVSCSEYWLTHDEADRAEGYLRSRARGVAA